MAQTSTQAPISHLEELRERLKLLPHHVAVVSHPAIGSDQPTLGQKLAERVAAVVGSWPFLIIQAIFLVLWLIYNTLQFTLHFDSPPYILLNLLLSFQAAFTGPVLLIAANVGALRDHAQSDRIETVLAQNETLTQQNADLVAQVVNLEQLIDEHIAASAQAHSIEISQVCDLIRILHVSVTGKPLPEGEPMSHESSMTVGPAQVSSVTPPTTTTTTPKTTPASPVLTQRLDDSQPNASAQPARQPQPNRRKSRRGR